MYVVGLIWYIYHNFRIILFFEALGGYWASSTVALWYFESGNPTAPIIRSVCRSIKSFGSIAFGSLLLTVVTVVKVVLEYINVNAH